MVAYCPRVMSPEMPRWAVLAVGLPLVSAMDPRALPIRVWLPLLGFLGWAAIGLSWTTPTWLGAGELWQMMLLTGALIAAANAENIDLVLRGAGWGIAVSSVIAAAQAFGFLDRIPAATEKAGLFFNKDFLAETAAPVFVYVAAGIRRRKMSGNVGNSPAIYRRFIGDLILAIFLAVPLVLSGSRASLLAAGLGLVVAWRRPWETKLPPLMVFGLAGSLGCMFLFGPDKVWSFLDRLWIWHIAVADITPLGHGLGWFRVTYPSWAYAHSDLLQAFVETGIVGGLLVACLAVSVVIYGGKNLDGDRFRSFHDKLEVPEKNINDGIDFFRSFHDRPLLSAFIASAVLATVSFPLHRPASAFVVAVLAGGLVRRGLIRRGVLDDVGTATDVADRHALDSSGVHPAGVRGDTVVSA